MMDEIDMRVRVIDFWLICIALGVLAGILVSLYI